MDKKYQIFISSTYTDLKEARMKVRDAILSMYHFPVGMELFGAASEEQWQIISETIDSSDYYVLIIAQRYGSIIPEGFSDAGISYTEKEFRYAKEKGIPILAFLLDDNVAVKPDYVETENRDKLIAFKNTVKTGRLVEWWTTEDDLAQKVTTALYKQITRTKRPGWIRGDAVDVEKSLKALTELTERNQKLIDENRALLAENQQLKQKSGRKPKLIVDLEADIPNEAKKEDSLFSRKENIKTEDDIIYLKVGYVETSQIGEEYQPMSKRDFIGELRGKVTDEEIEDYNKSLPSREEIEKYRNRYRNYHMIIDHGIAVAAIIGNVGTAKATDVSVTIEFPDEIQVLDINKVRKLKEPEPPKMPRDLREIAYERAHKSEMAMAEMLFPFEQPANPSLRDWINLGTEDMRNNIFESVNISSNRIDIETKNGIVHSKWDFFNGIYIVPMKKGRFKAKVVFMCAEYENPEEKELTFICE